MPGLLTKVFDYEFAEASKVLEFNNFLPFVSAIRHFG
jgi:hypothetical protein